MPPLFFVMLPMVRPPRPVVKPQWRMAEAGGGGADWRFAFP